jgi:chromosome partitioning protein
MPAEPKHFAELFNQPSVEAMHALTPREFEHFVAYVLRRAGYEVREVGPHWLRGVDLEMRRPERATIVGGVECKRLQSGDLVPAKVVTHVKGAAAVSRASAKPYVITTSDFHENAHKIAEAGDKRAYLMNGQQLVRYITYIRGSRYDDEDTSALISPEYFCGRDTLRPPVQGGAKILSIANNKGGVGKTTTAFYLGAALASQGKRVLLIDLDGQANLTAYCVPELDTGNSNEITRFPSIAQYFSGQQPLQSLVKSTSKERLSLIPSDPNLTLRDLGGGGRPDVELRFVRDVKELGAKPLASLGGVPDWIIIDTAPAMSVFTRAGLAAAQYVLAPMRPRRLSLPGTENMLAALRTVAALTNSRATFLGTVITHWDDLKLSQNFEDLLLPPALREFGGEAFKIKIPVDNRLEIVEPGAQTQGAKAYESLAIEVLNAVKSPIVQ